MDLNHRHSPFEEDQLYQAELSLRHNFKLTGIMANSPLLVKSVNNLAHLCVRQGGIDERSIPFFFSDISCLLARHSSQRILKLDLHML
jgi:hypothetical protein